MPLAPRRRPGSLFLSARDRKAMFATPRLSELHMDDFLLFVLVGAVAQVVDGALGMAHGVMSSSVLFASGVCPAQASASIHAAELFSTAASDSAHWVNRNVDRPLFWRLVLFGVAGYPGMIGAYLVARLQEYPQRRSPDASCLRRPLPRSYRRRRMGPDHHLSLARGRTAADAQGVRRPGRFPMSVSLRRPAAAPRYAPLTLPHSRAHRIVVRRP